MSVFVVVTEGACEKRAMAWLLEHGVPAYTPIARRWRYIGGNRIRYERPVFARYVFIESADIEADRNAIRRCRYATGLLGLNGHPKPVDSDVITKFLIVQSFGALDYTRPRKPALTLGQIVRIIGGQFKGYLATVAELRDKRVVISGSAGIMRGKMEIEAEKLEALPPETKAA